MNDSVPHPREPEKPEPTGLPLIWRIIGWLCLNLLLLAVALFLLLQGQFRFGLESMLAGPAGDRVEAVTEAIVSTLRNTPRGDWDQTLSRFNKAYRVEFLLVGPDGGGIAGKVEDLPDPVRQRILPPFRFSEGFRGGGPGKGPPEGKGPRLDAPLPSGPLQPRFSLRTEDPKRYWVGTRVPPLDETEPGPRRPHPWTLLIVTNSLYAGGLFVDVKLWVVAGLGTLLLSVLLWLPLVRGLTQTITQLTRATDEIARGNFAVRVPCSRTDELGQLGRSVNRMADRLDGFVKGQKRFLGDIAHELCSPIARMEVGLGIIDAEANGPSRTPLSDVREEVRDMSSLINELLSFSKASLSTQNGPLESVDLASLVAEVLRRENPDEQQIEIGLPARCTVLGHPDLLRRALANLIRNAIRYAGAAGAISISAEEVSGTVRLRICDLGSGVPEQDLQRIFDPFYRTEKSRSRDTGGAGLGLAIVKTCVDACGGSVQARNLQPHGFEVLVILKAPVASQA